jgi:CNT family concentrative nucleoside transporter
MLHLQSAFGIVTLLGLSWAISENRRAVDWKSAGVALLVTIATALLLLKVPQIKAHSPASTAPSTPSARQRLPAPRSCSAMSAAGRCRSN